MVGNIGGATQVGNTQVGGEMSGQGPDSELKSGRTCLLVLGMHRSGTSALARVLNLLGAALPQDLMGASRGNQFGHWEPAELANLNDKLLAELNSAWDDWRSLKLSDLHPQRAKYYREEIARRLRLDFGNAGLFVLKEPRTCRLVPILEEALADIDCRSLPVLCVRNPLEVYRSLEQREHMQKGHAALLWLRHNLDMEIATRGRPRSIIAYDRFLSEPFEVIDRLQRDLGIQLPNPATDVSAIITKYLRPSERHHTVSAEEVALDPVMRHWVNDAYMALLMLERNPESSPALKTIDRVRTEFDNAVPLMKQIANEFTDRLGQSTAQIEKLIEKTNCVATLRERAAHEASQQQNLIDRFRRSAGQREEELAALSEKLTSEKKRADDLAEKLAEAQNDYALQLAASIRRDGELTNADDRIAQLSLQLKLALQETSELAQRLAIAEDKQKLTEQERDSVAPQLERSYERIIELSGKLAKSSARIDDLTEELGRQLDAATKLEPKNEQRTPAEQSAAAAIQLKLDGKVTDLTSELATNRAEKEHLRLQLSAAAFEAQALRQTIAERDNLLARIYGSTSWKVMRPIRGIKRLATEKAFRQDLTGRSLRRAGRVIPLPLSLKERAKSIALRAGLIRLRPQVVISPPTSNFLGATQSAQRVPPATASSKETEKTVQPQGQAPGLLYRILWVVNHSDLQTQKYRVFNYAEELANHSVQSTIVRDSELDGTDPSGFDIVVLNRIAATDHSLRFVERCRSLGIALRYDIDDLVFCPRRINLIRFTADLPKDAFNLFSQGVGQRLELMKLCDVVTTSTDALAVEVRKLGLPAFTLPNTIGAADLKVFGSLKRRKYPGQRLRIGYFSGTRTHAKDFACCSEGLLKALNERPDTELMIVGELDVGPEYHSLGNRLVLRPLMPHNEMLKELSTVDINLAPLELHNDFTGGKSELKIFEAALMGIPTIASPTRTYISTIAHRETGMLAATPDEWHRALVDLIDDRSLREGVGEAARKRITSRFSVHTAVEEAKAIDLTYTPAWAHVSPPAEQSQDLARRAPKSQPAATVIAILYNKRNEIRYFLECLRRQDFEAPFEVLLIDDTSPDDSVAVVEDFVHQMKADSGTGAQFTVRVITTPTMLAIAQAATRL
ncbi:MAG: glycosyltransferase [Hyphomicrobiaceae bacterium]